MCRNIRTLFNFEPVATKEEIEASSLQYIRKISGYNKPSKANEKAFNKAVADVAKATQKLISSLETTATPKNREVEVKKAIERSKKRFGKVNRRNVRKLYSLTKK